MKYTDEINELEKEILTVSDNIAEIDLQLEVNEIHADGDDDYFNWIKKAKTARFFKVKRLNRLTLELKILNREAHSKPKNKGNTLGKILYNQSIEEKAKNKALTEAEKTKRHKISENINLLMFKEFKCRVKQLIGEEEYLKLIHECRDKIEGENNG
tara:strand:+ start:48 stop:515 length:468 start_codon:yes stop_codon:yes gene_type:complete